MDRRNLLTAAFAACGGICAAAAGAARAKAASPAKQKVVYHLCDLDKVSFVLGNIRNHFDGMGGPDNVTIALVVHGPALKAFHSGAANPPLVRTLGALVSAGLSLAACRNTMKAQDVTLAGLLPGFVAAETGGVVRIAELQSQGYAYLRP